GREAYRRRQPAYLLTRLAIVQSENFGETAARGCRLGVGSGRSKAACLPRNRGVEIDDFADRGKFPTDGLQTELQAGTVRFALQQPGQSQGHHAVEGMDQDLLDVLARGEILGMSLETL